MLNGFERLESSMGTLHHSTELRTREATVPHLVRRQVPVIAVADRRDDVEMRGENVAVKAVVGQHLRAVWQGFDIMFEFQHVSIDVSAVFVAHAHFLYDFAVAPKIK